MERKKEGLQGLRAAKTAGNPDSALICGKSMSEIFRFLGIFFLALAAAKLAIGGFQLWRYRRSRKRDSSVFEVRHRMGLPGNRSS